MHTFRQNGFMPSSVFISNLIINSCFYQFSVFVVVSVYQFKHFALATVNAGFETSYQLNQTLRRFCSCPGNRPTPTASLRPASIRFASGLRLDPSDTSGSSVVCYLHHLPLLLPSLHMWKQLISAFISLTSSNLRSIGNLQC